MKSVVHRPTNMHNALLYFLSALPLYLLAGFVFLSFAAGTGISLYLNAYFGASRVGELGLYIALVCDLFKIGLSAGFLYLQSLTARVFALLGILAFAALSILSSYGYTISHTEKKSGKHKAAQLKYQQYRNRQSELKQQIRQLGQHRPLEAIEPELKTLKQSPIYRDKRRSDQCRNATIPQSISYCARLNRLEVERLEAVAALPKIETLTAELQKTRQALNTINLSQVTQHSDPFARSFGTVQQVNLIFNLFLACLIEIATTAGLPLFIILLRAANKVQEKAKRQKHKTLITRQTRTHSDPDGFTAFMEDCVIEDPDSFITAEALLQAYQNWIQGNHISRPLNARRLGMRMTERGYTRVRRYIDTERRHTLYPGLRLKV